MSVSTAPSFTYRLPRMTGRGSVALFAPLYVTLVAGTGGAYNAQAINGTSILATNTFFVSRDGRNRKSPAQAIAAQIERIRSAFGLTMAEVADIFSVSRPTAYSWVNGASPRAEVTQKIWSLGVYAEEMRSLQVDRVELLKRRPLSDGSTLLAALKSGDSIDSAIQYIKQMSILDKEQMIAHRERIASKRRVYSADEVSIPLADRES